MEVRIANWENNSIVNGPGIRFVVWFQGCLRGCEDCHNPQTWNLDGGVSVPVDSLVVAATSDKWLSGVTVTGGEPFLQPRALLDFVTMIKKAQPAFTIIVYTGYTWEQLLEIKLPEIKKILSIVDAVVDGPYEDHENLLNLSAVKPDMLREELQEIMKWKGSSNQRLIDCKTSLKKKKVVCFKAKDFDKQMDRALLF